MQLFKQQLVPSPKTLLAAAACLAAAFLEGGAPCALGGVGASTPFVTYEAESGSLSGSAQVYSLTRALALSSTSSRELEASGRSFVELTANGDSVSWTNTVNNASAVNVRFCIPDSAGGGGISATLNVYVNGVMVGTLALSSAQTWVYGANIASNGMGNTPGPGLNPHVFWDEASLRIPAVPSGATITLKKDSATNTAAFYAIDCIDVEAPPAAATKPANALSITDAPYNAMSGGPDCTTAINQCIIDAAAAGKIVWIPQGTFHLTGTKGLTTNNVTLQGAGMWYSTIFRNPTLPVVGTMRDTFNMTSGTLKNLCVGSNATSRNGADGSCYSINVKGTNWLIDSVWVRNPGCSFWAAGSNGVVQNCRVNNSWADSCNLNNGNAYFGNNLKAQNNFARGGGDDGFAVFSNNYYAGSTQMDTISFLNNTSVAMWWASGMRLAGGKNVTFANNHITDSATSRGLVVGIFGAYGFPLESATVTGNLIERCGGNHGLEIAGGGTNQMVTATVTGNTVIDSINDGVQLGKNANFIFNDNAVIAPSDHGIIIEPNTTNCTASLSGNSVTGLYAGRLGFVNDAPHAVTPTLGSNIGFFGDAPLRATAATSRVGTYNESCYEGDQNVCNIANTTSLCYSNVNLNGVVAFVARVATTFTGASFKVMLDNPTSGTLVGTLSVPKTGGWQNWINVSCPVSGVSGHHNVYIVPVGPAGSYLFNIQWLQFTTAPVYLNMNAAGYSSVAGGVLVSGSSNGQPYLGNITNGSYTSYNNINFSGATACHMRVATPNAGGTIELRLDSSTGPLVGSVAVTTTGGWTGWADIGCQLTPATGTHSLYLVYKGGSGYLFNVQDFTLCGQTNAVDAASYNTKSSSILAQACAEGGMNLGYITHGTYSSYSDIDLTNVGSFTVRVASPYTGGTIQLMLDNPTTGTVVGSCSVPATGGWQTWTNVSAKLTTPANGFHDLYLVYKGGTGYLFNVENFQLGY